MARGSLAEEIWQEAQDQDIHPEIALHGRVRFGKDLCFDELAFVQRRKKFTAQALAKYLEIPEVDVDPQDVPVSYPSPFHSAQLVQISELQVLLQESNTRRTRPTTCVDPTKDMLTRESLRPSRCVDQVEVSEP